MRMIKQLSIIVLALLSMTGRVTMLGISRWAGKGGSYRTIQRFFDTVIPWGVIMWLFFKVHLYQGGEEYLLVGDETVVTKAGRETHGLDRFFSSIYNQPVLGLAFFGLSLVSVGQRQSYPIKVEQVVRSEAEKEATKKKQTTAKQPKKEKQGRPKGSKNKNKCQVELSAELVRIQQMVKGVLTLINAFIPLTYLVLDGHFGHNAAVQMVRQCNLHIISKLRNNSALYLPYDGLYAGSGPHRKYGDKLNYADIPAKYLKATSIEAGVRTQIYQLIAWHKDFPDKLNVVIVVKVNLKTEKRAHVVLFSSDLALTDVRLVDFYRLRFQIEFNFREAKQFWGLEDFMNVKEVPVTNAVNLSLFMVNLSQLLLRHFRQQYPDFNVLDLKAHFRGHKYVVETLKMLPQISDPILLNQIFDQISRLGSVNMTCSHHN